MAIRRFERTWLTLFRLFEELAAHDLKVDASQLRDSKTLLHLVRTTPSDPCVGSDRMTGDPLVALEQTIEKAKIEMMSASLELGGTERIIVQVMTPAGILATPWKSFSLG